MIAVADMADHTQSMVVGNLSFGPVSIMRKAELDVGQKPTWGFDGAMVL